MVLQSPANEQGPSPRPSPHPSRDSCHYLIIASGEACPIADPLAVDMDPHHHQFSCVDDRPDLFPVRRERPEAKRGCPKLTPCQ
jgi:hypothetical protein